MKKSLFVMLSLMITFLLITGCGKEKAAAVAVNEAADKCAICNMQVKDDAFAVQLTTKDGKNYKFDDIGCMNEWAKKNAADSVEVKYVRDYNTKEWIDYSTAQYVYDASFKTPMAYGIYSFKDKQAAQMFVDEQKKGKLMTATELNNHTWDRAKGNMDMHGQQNHDQNAHSETSKGSN
ncbi:nitrous oxide reductase accessory protein NosL [Paenibacillus sp. N1-5-1-14]|uniref:nitrous oxide reductase accessory protein NosL n=1 Tax=Paenibacillus radicibacter TaxID=2972488 RepID=UPI00215907F2|nr:nitrous oxide reductase accessory protein NosL [Paenibacillus radicibacter]MCR8645478.1 nitrous oxide reductase accessory protein NosL [Paenibacillus radicibacter]